MVFGSRYDKDIPINGGFKAKNYTRNDGQGFYQVLKTDTRKFNDLGIEVKGRTQRYTVAPNEYGIYKERRVGIHSQDVHQGTAAGNVPRRTDPVQEHYRKLGNYYKNKYGV